MATKPRKSKLETLAQKHWEYVAQTIFAHTGVAMEDRDYIICKHHYITAFIHGFKHGQEESIK